MPRGEDQTGPALRVRREFLKTLFALTAGTVLAADQGKETCMRTRSPLGEDSATEAVCSWGSPAFTHAAPVPTPTPTPIPTPTPTPTPTPVTYLFNPSFAGAAGTLPSSADWNWITGPGAEVGGNNEQETYVQSTANSYLDGNGNLVIAVTPNLNSARLTSKFSAMYPVIWEASIALQNVPGCWPAFWFLGQGSWPGCGEIDCMENYGTGFTDGTIWNSTATASQYGKSASTMDGDFHTYQMQWLESGITLSRDGTVFCSATPSDLTPWPFSTAHYCLLNIAVDGTGTGGAMPNTSLLPTKMLVAYVRAWVPAS